MNFFVWFISAFACYRVTVLLSRDLGPWNACYELREKIKALKCPYCTSVYIGVVTSVLLYIGGIQEPAAMWVMLSLSWSGSTIVLDRAFTSDYQPK